METKSIQTVQQPQSPANTFAQYLAARKKQIASVLPKHLTPERLCRVALTAYNTTPALARCDIGSIFQAVQQAAQLGLEPGGALGQAYLVPYGTQCQFIVGYRGLIELARRSGEIESIEAHVVHENDSFELEYGLETKLRHRPFLDGNAGPMRFVYAVARLKGGAVQFEAMTKEDIDSVRNRSRASRNGPWVTDYEEMAKKTVIRRLCKYLPISAEKLGDALDAEAGDYMEATELLAKPVVQTPAPESLPVSPAADTALQEAGEEQVEAPKKKSRAAALADQLKGKAALQGELV